MRTVALPALLALLSAGCKREPTPVRAAPSAQLTPLAVDAGAAPSAHVPCRLVDDATIDDGFGKVTADDNEELGFVRIFGDDAMTALTWTRTSHVRVGDNARNPLGALRTGTAPFGVVNMPVESSACASWGAASPNTAALPLVFWGAMNQRSFEQFAALPKVSANPYSPDKGPPYSMPDRALPSTHQSVHDIVASRDVALARVTELSCNDYCACPENTKEGLWLWGLDPKAPFRARAAAGKSDAPAFVLTEKGGVAAWRQDNELFYLLVDAGGKPVGAATSFARGEVGAPAVAMSGADPVLVWANRKDSKAPYRLQWMKVGGARHPVPTAGSAFAPAVIADGRRLVLAWMEGDAGKSGAIHVLKMTLDAAASPPSDIVSGAETNARDPELSGSVDHPAIVWSTFTKENAAGILRAGHLDCGK